MYYLIHLQNYNDGTATKKAMYEYESEDEALGQAHTYIGSAMKTSTVASCTEIVTNDFGVLSGNMSYVRKTEA